MCMLRARPGHGQPSPDGLAHQAGLESVFRIRRSGQAGFGFAKNIILAVVGPGLVGLGLGFFGPGRAWIKDF